VQLHDGHANLNGRDAGRDAFARTSGTDRRQDRGDGCRRKRPTEAGDVVERIDGRPAREVFDETASGISSATAQWRNWKVAQRFGPRRPSSTATLDVRGADGEIRTVKVACGGSKADDAIRRPAKLHEIKPGIWYVDITRLTDADLTRPFRICQAKGLVFRNASYPHGSLSARSPQSSQARIGF